MSKSIDNENYFKNVKDLKRSILILKLNIILSKHKDKNVKNIRKFLKILLTKDNMNKIVEKLKKFSCKSHRRVIQCDQQQHRYIVSFDR